MSNQTTDKLAKILVGKLPSETNSPVAIRRKYRANASAGKVASGFARITGSARAGDIARTAITAERLSAVGRDSETDTTGFKEQNRAARESAEERSLRNRERVEAAMERSGQGQDDWEDEVQQGISELLPTSKLDKPRTALNLQSVSALYAKRRRAS